MRSLNRGEISEWRAHLMVRETATLSKEHRAAVDEELDGRLAQMGNRQVAAQARGAGYRLDPTSLLRRTSGAESDRRVTLRPAPDTMTLLTGLLPVAQGVAVHAALRRHADSLRSQGDDRSLGQIMADTLVARCTGRADAVGTPVEVQLVMTDHALLAGGDEPARVPGHGPIPAWLARRLVREADKAWVRRLFASPTTGELVAMSSRRRHFPRKLATSSCCATRCAAHPGATHLCATSTTRNRMRAVAAPPRTTRRDSARTATTSRRHPAGPRRLRVPPSPLARRARRCTSRDRRPRSAGGRDPSSSSSTDSRTCARPCRPPETSRSPERVSSGLDPGDVRRPLVGRHVVGVAARVAVDQSRARCRSARRAARSRRPPAPAGGRRWCRAGSRATTRPGRVRRAGSWRSRRRSAPRPCGTARGAAPGSRQRWPTCRPPPRPSRPRSTEGSAADGRPALSPR